MDYIVPPRWKAPEKILNTEYSNGHRYAKYKCLCGKIFDGVINNVNIGRWVSCGKQCDLHKLSLLFYDYKDDYEFAMGLKLFKVRYDSIKGSKRAYGLFECHCCGQQFEALLTDVKAGHTRSCGCMKIKKFEYAPYYGKIDINPSKEKIIKAIKVMKREAHHEIYLTDEEIGKLLFSDCYWFGVKPSRLFFTKLGELPFYVHGVDRLDSSKPYTKENSVACSAEANYFKGAILSEKFLEMCNQVVKTNERRIRDNKTYTTGKRLPATNDSRAFITSTESRQEQIGRSRKKDLREIYP